MRITPNWLTDVRAFQESVREPVRDSSVESPSAALASLVDAVGKAPSSYRGYLNEAVDCYENHLYRAAILMVWAATMSHLYDSIDNHPGGIKAFEKANHAQYGTSKFYRKVTRKDHFLYIKDSTFLELAEKAGLYNRNLREILVDRLNLRNRCGHPTGYQVGREETVVFIESLCLNVLSGGMLNW